MFTTTLTIILALHFLNPIRPLGGIQRTPPRCRIRSIPLILEKRPHLSPAHPNHTDLPLHPPSRTSALRPLLSLAKTRKHCIDTIRMTSRAGAPHVYRHDLQSPIPDETGGAIPIANLLANEQKAGPPLCGRLVRHPKFPVPRRVPLPVRSIVKSHK